MSDAVRPTRLFVMSFRLVRTVPGRVLVPAAVVFALAAVATTVAIRLDDRVPEFSLRIVLVLFEAVAGVGLTFYAGLLDRLVGAIERGHEPPPVRVVLATLPYGRLIVADVLMWVLELFAGSVLLLPGLVVFTLFAITGPLINIEGHGVLGAFRHSARLVRPVFWLALLLITLPLVVQHLLLGVLEVQVPHEALWLLFLAEYVVGLVFGIAVGLMEVTMAETLMERDARVNRRARPAPWLGPATVPRRAR